jgi:hypothetical protein
MKQIFRQCVGFVVGAPFIVAIYISAVFIGKQRAIRLWGPAMTAYAKFFVKITLPKIAQPSEFQRFVSKIKARFRLWWRPIYDYDITYEDRNTLKFCFTNCPFCEALNMVKLSELNRYVCQGDWAAAHDYDDTWTFERQHQIGTGDAFCDHTYLRKQS